MKGFTTKTNDSTQILIYEGVAHENQMPKKVLVFDNRVNKILLGVWPLKHFYLAFDHLFSWQDS
jgi:hypothetical protein